MTPLKASITIKAQKAIVLLNRHAITLVLKKINSTSGCLEAHTVQPGFHLEILK